ncbi:MAG: MFS transporter, partial [Pseudomonadota bacterium]
MSKQEGLFYGWKVVGALFVMLAFSSGLGFYGHSIILQALVRESGFDVELASSAVSLFFLVSGLTGLIIAQLIERIDVRIVIIIGAVLASTSLWMIGSVSTDVELFSVYVIFGVGWSASGLLPATTLIARWFQSNRAKALSIASTGLSVGGITITPLMAFLVDEYSLAAVSPILGLIYLVGILPVTWFVLRSSPTDVGLNPDGANGSAEKSGILLLDAVRHPFFW